MKGLLLVAPLVLSHAWVVVTPGAPERKALERAGFHVAPVVNRHDGQGTASVTVEFANGFLELIYPDPTVPVAPASQAGAEKFRLKSKWRESGYSPIGIVLDRTSATPATFPFPTWRLSADWMNGSFIEMLTPREMPKAVSLSIASHPFTASADADPRRITALRVVAPRADALPPSARYISANCPVRFEVGKDWLLDVTLDGGAKGMKRDLRPELPMVVRW